MTRTIVTVELRGACLHEAFTLPEFGRYRVVIWPNRRLLVRAWSIHAGGKRLANSERLDGFFTDCDRTTELIGEVHLLVWFPALWHQRPSVSLEVLAHECVHAILEYQRRGIGKLPTDGVRLGGVAEETLARGVGVLIRRIGKIIRKAELFIEPRGGLR